MFSAHLVYGLGILVSILNMTIWGVIMRSQIKLFNGNNSRYKQILLGFSGISLISNITPIWYYIYRLSNNTNPTNIFYSFIINIYIYQTVTAIMFWVIYNY